MADYTLSAKGTYDGSDFDSGVDRSSSKLSSFMDRAKEVGGRVASALGNGISKAAGVMTSTVGTIGAAVTGLAATGGISRALNIEQAQYKLKQMGLDVESVMASCNEAVTGTAHGLDAAATVASSLGASGVQAGEQMTNALKAVAGMATMSGRSMEDIGLIFGKVAATGKVQGDELNQMAESGINATAELAKHLGKTQAEVREMVSAGEIDFQTFSDAMYASFGTAAQGANETFSGAMSNVRAALSRVGEMFVSPALGALRQVFAAMIPAINAAKVALQPLADSFQSFLDGVVPKAVEGIGKLQEMIEGLGEGGFANISTGAKVAAAAVAALSVGSLGGLVSQIPIVGDALGGLFGMLGNLANPIALVRNGLSGLGVAAGGLSAPIVALVAVAATLAAGFAYLFATNEQFRNSVIELAGQIASAFAPVLQQLADTLLPAIMSAVQTILPIIGQIITTVMQLAAALAPVIATIAASVIPIIAQVIEMAAQIVAQIASLVIPIVQQVTELIQANMPTIQAIIQTVMTAIQTVIQTVWPVIQQVITAAVGAIQSLIQVAWPAIQGIVTTVLKAIQSVVQAVWPVIQAVIQTAMGVIQGVITAVMGIINGDWSQVWNGIKQVASSVWSGIKSIVSSAASAVSGFVSNMVGRVTGFFGNLWSSITSKASSMWNGVKSSFSNGVSGAISVVSGLPGRIMGIFSGAGSWLINSGKSIINGLVSGIKNAIGGAVSAVSGAVGKIRSLFPFSPAKKGPFSGRGWVKYSGISIMDALAEGARSEVGKTVKAYTGMADRIRSAMDVSPSVSDVSVQGAASISALAPIDYGQPSKASTGTYEASDNRAKYVTFNVNMDGGNADAQEIAQDLYTLFKRNERGWAY